jgi:hypothetical protein
VAQGDLDRVLSSLTRDFQQFRTAFTQVGTQLTKTLTQAEATVKNIVSSSGGAAWDTFTGSLELVGLELAQFFVPTLVVASKGLQDLSKWFDGLGDETKDTIAKFAEVAAAGVVITKALGFLLTKTNLVAAAFGGLLYAMQKYTEWLDSEIVKKDKGIQEAAGKQYTKAEVEGSAEYKEIKALGSKEEQKKIIDERLKGLQHYISGYNPSTASTVQTEAWKLANKQIGLYEAIQRNLIAGEKLPDKVAEFKYQGLGGGYGIGGLLQMLFPETFGGGEDKDKKKKKGEEGGDGLLYTFPKEMQPRFSSVEEARKQFQIGALKSPLEQEIMQKQRELFQTFLNHKNDLPTVFGWFKKNWDLGFGK